MSAEHLALMARQLGMQPRFLAQQAADMAAQLQRAMALAVQELAPAMSPSARTLAELLERFVSTSTRKLAERIAA